MKAALFCAVIAASLVGCGTPGRPVGLPPPEYEEPRVEPWSPPAAPSAPPSAEPEPPPSAAPPPDPAASAAPPLSAPPLEGGGGSGTLRPGTP